METPLNSPYDATVPRRARCQRGNTGHRRHACSWSSTSEHRDDASPRPNPPSATRPNRRYLVRDEPRHNLILGVSDHPRLENPTLFPELRGSEASCDEGEEIVACALRTSPYNLVLAQPRDDEALGLFSPTRIDIELPGVVGTHAGSRTSSPRSEVDTDGSRARSVAIGARRLRPRGRLLLRSRRHPVARGRPGREPITELPPPLVPRLRTRRRCTTTTARRVPSEGKIRQRLQDPRRSGFTIWEDGGLPVSCPATAA